MAHVATGQGTRTTTDKNILERAAEYYNDHKNAVLAWGTLAPAALAGLGLGLPRIAEALGYTGGPAHSRALSFIDNDKVRELRAELLISENNLINQKHAAVATISKPEEMALYAPGGKLLSLEAQFAYTQEALNLSIKEVPYQAYAGGAEGVMQRVDRVLESHGAKNSTFRDAMGRTVMTWWYAYHCDYKTTYFPELAQKNIDTPEERREWAASQNRAIGTCIDHSTNLELHFKKGGILPEGSGSAVMHARAIWDNNRQVNTAPLPANKYGNHQGVIVYFVDDANSPKTALYDAYWLAPIVQKSQTDSQGWVRFKNHYYAGANGYSDPWAQVLKGIAEITHYPLTKDEFISAKRIADPDFRPGPSTYYVGPPAEAITGNRAQISERNWLQFNMSPVAAAVSDYNSQRR